MKLFPKTLSTLPMVENELHHGRYPYQSTCETHLTELDIAVAGTVGKAKTGDTEPETTQRPIVMIATLVVSLCGSGLYAYGYPVASVGLWPAIITIVVAVGLNAASISMMAPVSNHFDLPFDAIYAELGSWVSYVSNGSAVLLLIGVLCAVHIFNTNLFATVVYSYFLSEDRAYLAGALTCFALSAGLGMLRETKILSRILSFSFISVLAAFIALVYNAITASTPESLTCARDMVARPFSYAKWATSAGAGITGMAVLFAISASSLFVHNGLSVYVRGHPVPARRGLHIILAMGIAGVVYICTGLTAMLPYACTPLATPGNSSLIVPGPVGTVARVLFTVQCTVVAPMYLAIVRSATVDRLTWRRRAPRHASRRHAGRSYPACAPTPAPGEDEMVSSVRQEHYAVGVGGEVVSASSVHSSCVDDANVDASDHELALQGVERELVEAGMDNPAVPTPYWVIFVTNLCIQLLAALAVGFKLSLGTILTYAGAITGLVYVYLLPSIYWFVRQHRRPEERRWWRYAACTGLIIAGVAQLIGACMP